MTIAETKAAIIAYIANARDGLDQAAQALVNIQTLTAQIPDGAPAPAPAPTPTPTPAPTPTSGKVIWLSTHIGADQQTAAVCQQYNAIRPANSERCDFYSSAFDSNGDGTFDGETSTFKGRCSSFGADRIYPISMDWESYGSGGNMNRELGGKDGTSKQTRAIGEYLKVIAAIRKYCPKAKVGIYDTPDCASGYSARLNQDAWWMDQEDSLARIWAAVDFIAPCRYISYAVTDSTHWSDAKDIQLCTNEANLCKRIKAKHPQLLVLPYYQYIYRNSQVSYNLNPIPVKEWYNHIKRFNDICGDGAIWWSGTGSPTLPVSHLKAMRQALDGTALT